MLQQPRLADTLDQLAHAGFADFYRGDVAQVIADDLERIGSPVTRADLERHVAKFRPPLSMRLEEATLYNAPPPTQGLASLLILGIFERARRPTRRQLRACARPRRGDQARLPDPRPRRHRSRFRRRCLGASRRLRAGTRGGGNRPPPRRAPGRNRRRRATRSGSAPSTPAASPSPISSRYSSSSARAALLPATGITWQNRGSSFALDPGRLQSAAAGPQAVPHAEPGHGALRRRPHHELRHHGRRRPAADAGRPVHPLCPLRHGPRRRHRRAALAARPDLGARRRPISASRTASTRTSSRRSSAPVMTSRSSTKPIPDVMGQCRRDRAAEGRPPLRRLRPALRRRGGRGLTGGAARAVPAAMGAAGGRRGRDLSPA